MIWSPALLQLATMRTWNRPKDIATLFHLFQTFDMCNSNRLWSFQQMGVSAVGHFSSKIDEAKDPHRPEFCIFEENERRLSKGLNHTNNFI